MRRGPRWILRWFPASFRKRYGDEIAEFMRSRTRELGARHDWIGVARFWLRSGADLAHAMVAERRDARRIARQPAAVRGDNIVLTVLQDLRFALRMWQRLPGTVFIIVAALALGIAASSTIFSWAQGLIWRPLPAVQNPHRLVSLKPQGPAGQYSVAWQEFEDWRDQSRSYERVAAFSIRRVGLRATGTALDKSTEPAWGMLVTGDYFAALGVNAQLGRLIDDQDARFGKAATVTVISHALWQRRFGGDAEVVGRRIVLNGREVTIIGVAPPRFAGTYVGLSFDVWLPMTMETTLGGSARAFEDREFRWLQAFGRLRPGLQIEQAAAEAAGIGRRLAADHAASRSISLVVQDLDVGAASRLAPLFAVLLGLTTLVLVVVCATVANLLMARATAREGEMALRIAIGARPIRLARQLITETALLAMIAGGLGVILSIKTRSLFPALLPPSPLPLAIDTPLDVRVVAFAVAVTVLTLVLFSLAPTVNAVRKATAAGLRATIDIDRARWRRGLVAAQIALSLAALASGALFAERLLEMREVDRGFDAPERVMLAATDFDLAGIADPDERRTILDRLMGDVRALPSVSGAAAATFVPLGFTGYREMDVEIPGDEPMGEEPVTTLLNEIGPDYFDVMGIPLVAGRRIDNSDRHDGRPVVVTNEAFVRRFAMADPLEKRVRLNGRDVVIVGVARDGKYRFDELEDQARPMAYVPWEQWGASSVTVHARTPGEPAILVPDLTQAFAAVDARLPLLSPMTLDAYTSLPLFPARLATTVVGVLAAAVLVLCALGLYAVTSFAVASRTRELGIRVALGARPAQLVSLLFSDSARFTTIGLVAGIALAFATMRVLLTAIPSLQPSPLAIGMAALLLVLVAVVALSVATRRVLHLDPATALRDANAAR